MRTNGFLYPLPQKGLEGAGLAPAETLSVTTPLFSPRHPQLATELTVKVGTLQLGAQSLGN